MRRLTTWGMLPAFALLAACSGGGEANNAIASTQPDPFVVANVPAVATNELENAAVETNATAPMPDEPAAAAKAPPPPPPPRPIAPKAPARPKAEPKAPPPPPSAEAKPKAPPAAATCTPEHRALGHC
jgi:outer membrane biosynthesis protein TonB